MAYKNKADDVAYKKAWYQANKEKRIDYSKEYGQKHKKEIAVKQKVYKKENKEILAKYKKAWNKENKEKIAKYRKVYGKENKEKIASHNVKRRELQINLEAIMTKEEVENYKNLVKIRDEATALFGYQWHIDHTTPLSQGGTNAIDNLEVVPASWNLEKNNRHSQSFWG